MSNADAMKQDLPLGLFTDDPESFNNKEIDVIGKQLDSIVESILDLEKQFSIKTCTWALEIYEKEYKVPVANGSTIEERRSNVMAMARGGLGTNPASLKVVAEAYINGEIDIREDFPNYEVVIKFVGRLGVPTNLSDIQNMLRRIIPAHLGIKYEFSYLLIKDVHNVMTINQIQATTLDKFAGGV